MLTTNTVETVLAHTPETPGKKGHTLADHLSSVANLAASSGAALGIASWVELAGYWHDLGKFRPRFQAYLRGEVMRGDNTSHKLAGAAWALQHLGKHPAAMPIALAIAGHHGGLPAWSSESGGLKSRMEAAQAELDEARLGGAEPFLERHPGIIDARVDVVMRSLSVADSRLMLEILTRFLFSALVDADWSDTSAYYANTQAKAVDLSAERSQMIHLDGLLSEYLRQLVAGAVSTPVNDQRVKVLHACWAAANRPTGIHELTVPTGGGKTLAAMAFALRHAAIHGLRRVVVVLPYTSIIEQNAAVYRRVFGEDAVLEHHSNLDLDQVGDSRLWKLHSETWDVPIIVTTNVQFLETLHTDRPSRIRKLHRLAQSVIILDECQALPIDLLDVTCDTLRVFSKAFGSTIVTCTATQPAFRPASVLGRQHQRLGHEISPIITDPAPLFTALTRVQVRWPEDATIPTTWTSLAKELASEPTVLVIVHRRQDAREATLEVDKATGNKETIHLSAQMIPAHRSQVLVEIRRRLAAGEPCRVVSTNLVEAGVDLDFPVVYRCLGGLDALAQAAGRCNREGRSGLGQFRIFRAPSSPPKGLETNLNITLGYLRSGAIDLQDPAIFQRYFSDLYQQNTDGRNIGSLRDGFRSDFPEIAKRYRVIDADQQRAVVVDWPDLNPETRAAIARLRSGYAEGMDLRRVQRASVMLPVRIVQIWQARGAVQTHSRQPIPILSLDGQEWMYDTRFGLCGEADPEPPTSSLIL